MASKRVNVKAILADADLRRKLMVSTIQATQAREGIETSPEQADRAYYVVTESDKAVFFDLKRFRGNRESEDSRELEFVRALSKDANTIRFDVARRDFAVIDGSPLAYRRIGVIGHLFREHAPLEPAHGRTRRGAYTGDDPQYVRFWWEPGEPSTSAPFEWKPFAKGGDYSRFYADVSLVVHWDPERRTFARYFGRKGRETERPESLDDYFKPGLTWPRRTQRGFNVRVLPSGCVFADKGPAIFANQPEKNNFLLAVCNSGLIEFVLQGLTSFGSWETSAVKKLPIPDASERVRGSLATLAESIHRTKASWDEGNEVSRSFAGPWLLRASNVPADASIYERLDRLRDIEADEEAGIGNAYAAIEAEVYRLYGIPASARAKIEEALGPRPPEVLWPQMENKTTEQKRMEHVWRLLSFAVKRVIDSDDDGIVPFNRSTGETPLPERVRQELATLFPGRDESQLEVEIVNELKRSVKGYRKCASLDDWLANAYFEYHAGLYKSRPIYWHVASAQGTSPFAFGALVHYHRFDKNRMQKLRASYVRDTIEELRRDAGHADKAGRADDRVELQAKLEEVQTLDKKLQLLQEGHHEGTEGGDRDFRILTPWKEPAKRPKGWNPDLDDGVKVNIAPLDRAGILRVSGIAG